MTACEALSRPLRAMVLALGCLASFAASAQAQVPLVVAVPQEPTALDICTTGSNPVARVLLGNVAEGLTDRGADGQVKPLLATAWKQVSPMVWEFTLRSGVVFHDGTPFNAQAAATSMNRSFQPQLTCNSATQYFGVVKLQAQAVDAGTLRVTTSIEDAALPLRLSFLGMASPKTPADKLVSDPVGTGPYRMARWDRSERIILERWQQYWGPAPQVTRVTYLFRPEDLVRAEMVGAGEADLALGLPLEFAKHKGALVYDLPETLGLRIHTQSPPFDNIKVRKAMQLAIDRQSIINAVWGGGGVVASQPIPPGTVGFDPKAPAPAFNLAQAKKLIAEARQEGAPVNRQAIMYTRLDVLQNGEVVAQALAQQLNNIGLNVKVQILEAAPWIQILLSRPTERPGFILEPHSNILGDASLTANSKYHSSQRRSQVPDAQRPVVDDMIVKAAGLKGAAREQAYQKLFAYLNENVVQDVFIANTKAVMIVRPGVEYHADRWSNEIVRIASIRKRP